MTILLIGRDGQIGHELGECLAPLGRVLALDHAEIDLADPDSIRAAVRSAEPSLIVNAAAYTAVDKAEEEFDLAHAVNGAAPGILAEEAKRLGAPLVHYSTDYVFDGTASRAYLETDAAGPLGVYGHSKLAGEQAIQAVGGAYLILRTSWIYSLHGHNFLLTMRRLAGEREELSVVDDQTGSPTWARLVAEATAEIVKTPEALAEKTGLYHLTAAGRTTWHGFTEAIIESMREAGEPVAVKRVKPIATADYPTPARRPAWSVLDCSKIRETFGFELTDWRAQLRLCLGL